MWTLLQEPCTKNPYLRYLKPTYYLLLNIFIMMNLNAIYAHKTHYIKHQKNNQLQNISHPEQNVCSRRQSACIQVRYKSNFIFDWIPGFNALCFGQRQLQDETKWDLVRLILEVLRYLFSIDLWGDFANGHM